MVREMNSVHYINVIAEALEREDGCFSPYVAEYDMGLDA